MLQIEKQPSTRVRLTDVHYLCSVRAPLVLLSGAWESIPFRFQFEEAAIEGKEFDVELRIFSEVGTQELPFTLEISEWSITEDDSG